MQGLLRAEATPAASGRAYWIADAEPYELRDDPRHGARRARGRGPAGVRRAARASRASPAWSRRGSTALLQARGRYVQALHVLGELKDTIACDITRARAELGYDPQTSLLDGHAGERPVVPRAGEIL